MFTHTTHAVPRNSFHDIPYFEINIPGEPERPVGLLRVLGTDGVSGIRQSALVLDAKTTIEEGRGVTLRGPSRAVLEELRDLIVNLPKPRALGLIELLADPAVTIERTRS